MTFAPPSSGSGRFGGAVLAALLPLAAPAGAQVAGTATGTIEGRVLYRGEVPPATIVMEGGGAQQVLYVASDGGLRHAFVFLPDAPDTPSPATAERPPETLRQSGFIFEPQVLAVRDGETVRFTNEDGANHNVRSDHAANRFSLYTGAGQQAVRRLRAAVDPPVTITCDVHPWMIAWIYVVPHPQFAVTDTAGRFRLTGVPQGTHRLSVRQPAGGLRRDVTVRVIAGEATHVELVFTTSDLEG